MKQVGGQHHEQHLDEALDGGEEGARYAECSGKGEQPSTLRTTLSAALVDGPDHAVAKGEREDDGVAY